MANDGMLGIFDGHFLSTCRLADGAVAADLGTRDQHLKAEVRFHLTADALQGLTEELFDLAAAEADDMRMFLLEARFVVVLLTVEMHQVELIDQSAGLEHLQGPVHSDAVDLWIFFFRKVKQAFGV